MLLEYRVKGDPIPLPYFELYQFLFTPVLWERSGNVHPLVRLLSAYITRMNPAEMQTNLQLVSFAPRPCYTGYRCQRRNQRSPWVCRKYFRMKIPV